LRSPKKQVVLYLVVERYAYLMLHTGSMPTHTPAGYPHRIHVKVDLPSAGRVFGRSGVRLAVLHEYEYEYEYE